MNTILWICQSFLALVFVYSGVMKSTQTERWLIAHKQTGVEGLPVPLIRFIGVSEILGVAGILVPSLTGIMPLLTPIAALCFSLIMIFAARIHYRRNEMQSVVLNIIILCVSMFVAFERFKMLLTIKTFLLSAFLLRGIACCVTHLYAQINILQ